MCLENYYYSEKAEPYHKWLILAFCTIIPLHITRSVLYFTSYPDIDQNAVQQRDDLIDFFAEEWGNAPFIDISVTKE